MDSSPAEEYAARLKDREMRVEGFERMHIWLGNVRLLVLVIAIVVAWWSMGRHAFAAWWIAGPVAVFVGIALLHSRVLRRQANAERAAQGYRNGIARIEDCWAGKGRSGERFAKAEPHHLYAGDLDLFGAGSLFELLATTWTRIGEEALAEWLLKPAEVGEIRERQAAVEELRPLLDLREELAAVGKSANVGVNPKGLLNWAEAENRLSGLWLRWVAPVLAAGALAAIVYWLGAGVRLPLLAMLVVNGGIVWANRKRYLAVLEGTSQAFADMKLLAGLLERLEREKFACARLREIQQELLSGPVAASAAIKRLGGIVDWVESRDNPLVKTLDVPLLFSLQVAFAAEAWRRAHGLAVRRWTKALGEMEALLALATYRYEHPADVFPEIVEGEPCFQAEQLGHPLIATAKCVRNDVSVCHETRALIISGSNMSGKSTLMRAVGVNTVLAMMGAPVRAKRLRLTRMQVGASIRVNDSLQEGSSRFYAEILRLRQIYELAGAGLPVLFLLDELLQGTNSEDRRVGAEGIIQALLERGSIGIVSTHDLALTSIGDGKLRNMHLQDEIVEGRIQFDFRLRDGVVEKSNGVELMRSIGLRV